MVCIPLLDGVVELGTTERVRTYIKPIIYIYIYGGH